MKLPLSLLTVLILLPLVGCRQLDGYKRSYSLNYVTPQGQPVGVGITLDPVKRSGK